MTERVFAVEDQDDDDAKTRVGTLVHAAYSDGYKILLLLISAYPLFLVPVLPRVTLLSGQPQA
jgi:hypothetical protein